MRIGYLAALVAVVMALGLASLASADSADWSSGPAASPVSTILLGLALMMMTILGSLLLFLLGGEDDSWRQGGFRG